VEEVNDMSLRATAHAVPGTLRQELLIDGAHSLVTDQPVPAGGTGMGPSPHELFPAGLAGCVAVTLAAYARTKAWDLGDLTVDVDYDHRSTPRRLATSIRLTGNLSAGQLERLEKVAAACPLRRSIQTGFDFVDRIETSPTARAA
jgi:putative redox protein